MKRKLTTIGLREFSSFDETEVTCTSILYGVFFVPCERCSEVFFGQMITGRYVKVTATIVLWRNPDL